MPARSTSFQRLITVVHACSISKIKISESAMLKDLDAGENREVDILITSEETEYQNKDTHESIAGRCIGKQPLPG